MSNKTSLKVQLKKHVANYLAASLKSSNANTIYITADSDFGAMIYSMVEKSDYPPKPIIDKPVIELWIPERDFWGNLFDGRCCYLTISEVNTKRLNKVFETMMRNELYSRLNLLYERGEIVKKGGKMKGEINKWYEKYNIDVADMSYDMIVKDYYRRRKSEKSILQTLA